MFSSQAVHLNTVRTRTLENWFFWINFIFCLFVLVATARTKLCKWCCGE